MIADIFSDPHVFVIQFAPFCIIAYYSQVQADNKQNAKK
jgi:hypothetical protein